MTTHSGPCTGLAWPAALIGLIVLAGPIAAQDTRPPRWTASLEFGAQLPTTLYDERITATIRVTDTTISGGRDRPFLATQYRERIDALPMGRLIMRYRPQAEFAGYVAAQYGAAGTTATYVGGGDAPDTLSRKVRIWAFEFGLSMQLGRWADGRGLFEYSFGPSLIYHSLDLSSGHRDVLAVNLGAPQEQPLDWTNRKWYSWGLGLGASTRIPISEPLSLRIAAQAHVVSVSTSQLETQDREDVRRLTGGRAPVILYPAYTAHYPAVRVGLEYVVSRQTVRPLPTATLPVTTQSDETSAETGAALRLLAAGDTAAALEILQRRVADQPEDASAWRELALVLAERAELGPAARDEAWNALQRAVHTNPGDDRLLSAYGRVRSLQQRGGAVRREAPPLALSAVNARADAAGALSLAWTVQNLADADGIMRYRIAVEVVDERGDPVGIRPADSAEPAGDSLELLRSADAQPVVERLELRLAHARAGPYSVRVRVTDLGTGQTVDRVAGFEIR